MHVSSGCIITGERRCLDRGAERTINQAIILIMEFVTLEPPFQKPQNWVPCTKGTKQCQYWTWGKDYLRPECCTNHLKELLFFVEDLLTEQGIFHWLDFGSLLGAVRGQELIPWDNDVDFGVLKRDAGKIHALEAEVIRAGHYFVYDDALRLWRIYYSQTNRAMVDIDPWEQVGGFLKNRKLSKRIPGWFFPKRYLENLEPVLLYGRAFPAPSPVQDFLAHHRYGPDYKTPQRRTWDLASAPDIDVRDLTPPTYQLLDQIRERDYLIQQLERQTQGKGNSIKAPTGKLGRIIMRLKGQVWSWYHSEASLARIAQVIYRWFYWESRHVRWLVIGRLAFINHKLKLGYMKPDETTLEQLPAIRPDEFTQSVGKLLYTIRKRDLRIQQLETQIRKHAQQR